MRAHLNWISENPKFKPKRGLFDFSVKYLDEMTALYSAFPVYHETSYQYFKDDVVYSLIHTKSATEEALEKFNLQTEKKSASYFVTWNFTEEYFNKNKDKIIKNLNKFLNNKWLTKGRAVFEYHTKNGSHPHIMALLETDKYKKIYDFKDAIFQLALSKGLARNFIDVNYAKSYHHDYINLDKAIEKTEYLDKDITWRIDQGIDAEYTRQI